MNIFEKYQIARTPPLNDGKDVVVTSEGEELEDDIRERGTGKAVVGVGVTGMGVEGVGEGEGGVAVKDESEVVRVESNVSAGSVVNDGSGGVEENTESGSSERVEVEKSGMLVGDDKSGKGVEGSITEESKGDTLLEPKSAGGVTDEGISVEVSVDGSESSGVGVGVSNVPVLDGNTSVTVGSSVCVDVGGELSSNGVEEEGVDIGKSVGVSVEEVECVRWRDLVKNGGTRPVKLKGKVKRSESSSSLMEGFDEPQ
jgi:hypothetical protein